MLAPAAKLTPPAQIGGIKRAPPIAPAPLRALARLFAQMRRLVAVGERVERPLEQIGAVGSLRSLQFAPWLQRTSTTLHSICLGRVATTLVVRGENHLQGCKR